jgi:DivIVA domain-containing protein
MEISPKTFRDVEFREKRHGYHPEDVDQFLEQMAIAVEAIQERLRVAQERAQRAEQTATDASSSDEALRRTLVLAQRTADMAVQESREQAARILSAAEAQAQSVVAEAEERARRLHGEALADVHSELAKFESTRAQAQEEVDALSRWAAEHRAHLTTALKDALATVERAGVLSSPPSSSPIELPGRLSPSAPAPVSPGPPADSVDARPVPPLRPTEGRQGPPTGPPQGQGPPPSGPPVAGGPPPLGASPVPGGPPPPGSSPVAGGPPPPAGAAPVAGGPPPVQGSGPFMGGPARSTGGVPAQGQPTQALPVVDSRDQPNGPGVDARERDLLTDPDDEALDSYFGDNDLGDDRRFGGRLRRRR